MTIAATQIRGVTTVTAAILVATVLGSIHAFSIFTPGWQELTHSSRGQVSFVYSLALVALTTAVLFGYRIYQVFTAPAIFLLVGVVAGAGLVLTAGSHTIYSLYIFYGLLFGGANGLGYGYTLQLSAQAAPNHRGFSMCLITAFYAVGATLAPFLFSQLISAGGNTLALRAAGGIIFFISVLAALMVWWSGITFKSESLTSLRTLSNALRRARWLLWIGYGASVISGLMIIGHAYSVAGWLGFGEQAAIYATVIVALGNMAGGFSAVYFSDRVASRKLLLLLPLLTTAGLLILTSPLNHEVVVGLMGLGLVGYCYGALIAIYPVAIASLFGTLSAPRIYGQIFTAWGFAGLIGPWLSGLLFDVTQSYSTALVIGIVCNFVAVIAVHLCLPRIQLNSLSSDSDPV